MLYISAIHSFALKALEQHLEATISWTCEPVFIEFGVYLPLLFLSAEIDVEVLARGTVGFSGMKVKHSVELNL